MPAGGALTAAAASTAVAGGAGAAAGGAAAAGGGGIAGLLGQLGGAGATAKGLTNVPAGIVQAGLGGIQSLIGAGRRRGAQQQAPPLEDPETRAQLNRIKRERARFRSGTAFEASRRALRQQQTQTQRGVLRASGGAGGAAIAGLSRAQRATGEALSQIAQQSLTQQRFLTGLEAQTQERIGQRRLELQLLRESRGLAEAAQLRTEGTANILAAIGANVPVQQRQPQQPGAGGFPPLPATPPIVPPVVGQLTSQRG